MVNQNAGRSHSIKTDNSSFERVEEFQFFGTTFTNQNSIQEENHSTLQSGDPYCHLVKNLLYRYEIWCLILKEKHMQREFQNKVLRSIFESKRDEITVRCRELCSEELNDMYCSPNTIWVTKSRGMRWVWQ
jgi:hypothetical protein